MYTVGEFILLDINGNTTTVSPSGDLYTFSKQDGIWNINNISGTISLPTGASTSALQTTGNSSLSSIDGKITTCNTGAVTISTALPTGSNTIGGVNLSQYTPVSGRLPVDGSGVTQPISGTVTANAGTGNFTVIQGTGTNLHTVVDSGTITTITNNVPTNITQVTGSAISATNPLPNRLTDGTAYYTKTGQTLATAPSVQVTDGTNSMPTMDTVARAGFQKITNGTNTLLVNADGSVNTYTLSSSGNATWVRITNGVNSANVSTNNELYVTMASPNRYFTHFEWSGTDLTAAAGEYKRKFRYTIPVGYRLEVQGFSCSAGSATNSGARIVNYISMGTFNTSTNVFTNGADYTIPKFASLLEVEITTKLSATATTLTITYTNNDGVAGRTATCALPASAAVGRRFKATLQAGDIGVRDVTNVTDSANPTGVVEIQGIIEIFSKAIPARGTTYDVFVSSGTNSFAAGESIGMDIVGTVSNTRTLKSYVTLVNA